ncbi:MULTISPECIES: IS66 family insertion sequence element accessory protein TnpB [Bradyrhizobium]|nr:MULTISPECIES: IS66 family insertion sequence element accessory protein TnpB [Bradyrhizobium]
MIGLRPGLSIWIATQPVDFRRGMDSLAMLVSEAFGADPFDGGLYIFRSKRRQHATFCIQSSKRDNCISVASAFSADASGRTFPTRQGFEVHLYRGAAWV